ncbi:MAG: fumarylacetoacetate hydrolase family protein [Oscillospiraceae bacterium]|nr:fumarylacetoacetate hydrolase family protein [Oscillospiraceae bacterium]
MKLINMYSPAGNRLGILTERGVIDVASQARDDAAPVTVMQALHMGLDRALPLLRKIEASAAAFLPEAEIVYAPAVDDPEKIFCIGVNYRSHIEETVGSFTPAEAPTVFAKFRNSLAPHRGVVLRNRTETRHDYEAEIAVVIGRRCAYVSPEEALDYVFGYTLANDISARTLQKVTTQWVPGKTCDTFCPLGPCIVTADALPYQSMHLTGYKNGELRQEGWSTDMLHDIPALVSYLSNCCTLEPGDVILTGTPAGVILGRPPEQQDWLQPGDVLDVCEDTIGTLTVTVRDA